MANVDSVVPFSTSSQQRLLVKAFNVGRAGDHSNWKPMFGEVWGYVAATLEEELLTIRQRIIHGDDSQMLLRFYNEFLIKRCQSILEWISGLRLPSQTVLTRCLKTSKNETYAKIISRVRRQDLKTNARKISRKIVRLKDEKDDLLKKRNELLEKISIEKQKNSRSRVSYAPIDEESILKAHTVLKEIATANGEERNFEMCSVNQIDRYLRLSRQYCGLLPNITLLSPKNPVCDDAVFVSEEFQRIHQTMTAIARLENRSVLLGEESAAVISSLEDAVISNRENDEPEDESLDLLTQFPGDKSFFYQLDNQLEEDIGSYSSSSESTKMSVPVDYLL